LINLPSGAEAHPIEAISIGTAEAEPFQSHSFEMVRLPWKTPEAHRGG
jgi:hypothetical protein